MDTPPPAALLSTGAAELRNGAARLSTGGTLLTTIGAAMLMSGAATLSTGAAMLSTGAAMVSTGAALLRCGVTMLSSGAMLLRGTGMVVMGGRRLRAGTAVGASSAGLLSVGVVSLGVPVRASRGSNSEVARVTTGARLLISPGVAAGREDTSGVVSTPLVTGTAGSCTGKGFSVDAPEDRGTAGASGAASGDTAAEQRAPRPLPVEMTVTAWLKEGGSPHRSGLFETSLHAKRTSARSRCTELVPDAQQAPRVASSQGCREGTFTGQADACA